MGHLFQLCVDRLLDNQSPSLDTVKMQVYFDMNYTSRADFLEEHRRVLDQRLQPVVREITDSRARTRDELEAALQSVFPQTELGTFMSLTKRDKERQLSELTLIVTGIRLFNRECGKGGEGIDDLPAILSEAIPATTQNVRTEIQNTTKLAFTYTALIEDTVVNQKALDGLSLSGLKEALINTRQHEAFLSILLNDVMGCAQQVDGLESQFAARMETLKNTVQSKTAVPTAQVYPQFITLAHLWTGFQDEMVLLSVLSNILASLEPFTKGFCGWSLVVYDRLLIPSNPANGVLRYNDNYYSFCDKQAAYEFANAPDSYITGVAEAAKKSPELIQLLELHTQFASITPYAQANLRTKLTHSMQTNLSQFRRDNDCQVYLPKDAETQTKRDSSTNVPKPSTFVAGLRGCNSTKTTMNVVDLTLDIDQT
ncbi:Cilia- and flagella-associated protein 206 [Acropora cervicornis]|uniref:Cilia- and flagella-associated protein 206 n=1 Tax=Acropora cervicornis TaxID=6130 RepID=A0AAD9R3P0_ACRCE|nr:Cilia- and flagella-associated protein 206 [Acropora cervicornis]